MKRAHGDAQVQDLAAQLGYGPDEIAARKDLFGFGPPHERALAAARDHIAPRVDEIVDEFYRRQLLVPEIRDLIDAPDTLSRLSGTMRRYVLSLFSGRYGADHVASRLRIGKVHAIIGVPPKLYIASKHLLEELIVDRLETAPARPILFKALGKILLFDLQIVIDTYIQGKIDQIDSVHHRAREFERVAATRIRAIERLAVTDDLTRLLNRRALQQDGATAIARARATGRPLSVLFMDVDDFKAINDAKGHQYGDTVLQRIGALISRNLRSADSAYRFGGDEFCVLLPETGHDTALRVAARLTDALADAFDTEVTLSIGIASRSARTLGDFDELLSEVDWRMYHEKARRPQAGDAAAG